MGAYINPQNESKEAFLEREGLPLSRVPNWTDVPEGMLPVCLVDNGAFTAAGICYDRREVMAFSLPHDIRPKRWFLVDINKLYSVSDLEFYRPKNT